MLRFNKLTDAQILAKVSTEQMTDLIRLEGKSTVRLLCSNSAIKQRTLHAKGALSSIVLVDVNSHKKSFVFVSRSLASARTRTSTLRPRASRP